MSPAAQRSRRREALPLLRQEVQTPSQAPSSSTAERRSSSGSTSSGSCATTSPSSARPNCAVTPQDRLRVAPPRARHGVRLPRPDRAARHRLGGRVLHQRHRPLQGLRGQARKRGLTRQKLCICVVIDVHKNPVTFVCGHGKPCSARVRKCMGGRIAPGSLLIYDLESAHNALVRSGGLDSEAHGADVNDPVYLERMEIANDLCSWLKRYLGRFTGMSPRNLWRISTCTSISSGSTRRATDRTRPKGWRAISWWMM